MANLLLLLAGNGKGHWTREVLIDCISITILIYLDVRVLRWRRCQNASVHVFPNYMNTHFKRENSTHSDSNKLVSQK